MFKPVIEVYVSRYFNYSRLLFVKAFDRALPNITRDKSLFPE